MDVSEVGGDLRDREGRELELDGSGSGRWAAALRGLREQEEGCEGGRLFEDFEEGVGGLFHEGRGGEDVNAAAGFGGLVIDGLDHAAHLPDLDQHLRGIGGDDHDLGMGLNEDAGVLFVGLLEGFTGFGGLGGAGGEVVGLRDAQAVIALAAEIGETVGEGQAQAVHRLRGHLREGVFARAFGAGKDEGMGKAIAGKHLADAAHGFGIAVKVGEGQQP